MNTQVILLKYNKIKILYSFFHKKFKINLVSHQWYTFHWYICFKSILTSRYLITLCYYYKHIICLINDYDRWSRELLVLTFLFCVFNRINRHVDTNLFHVMTKLNLQFFSLYIFIYILFTFRGIFSFILNSIMIWNIFVWIIYVLLISTIIY